MYSFDGAAIFELAGLYIQSNVENILPKTNRLYQNDKLILLRNLNAQQMDKQRKIIIKIILALTFKQIFKK